MRPELSAYTCRHYREEMLLLKLQNRLEKDDLSREERQALLEEIARLQQEMGME